MKKKILFLVLSMLLLFIVGAGTAAAEPSLTEIMNGKYGDNHWSQLSNDDNVQFSPTSQSVSILFVGVDHQAGDTNALYWYNVADPSVIGDSNLIFSAPVIDSTQYKSIDSNFGLCIKPDGQKGTRVKYSEKRVNILLNADEHKYAEVFNIKDANGNIIPNKYVVAFEDGDAGWGPGVEPDYQDLVVELSPVSVNVPEFPTVALPVAAVLGLIFIFGRKKGDL
jgi:hypothetical protein